MFNENIEATINRLRLRLVLLDTGLGRVDTWTFLFTMKQITTMNWTVKFLWPSSALGYYTFLTMKEARTFAKMFGKKISINLNEREITIA